MKGPLNIFKIVLFGALGVFIIFFSKAYFDLSALERWALGSALIIWGGYKVYLIIMLTSPKENSRPNVRKLWERNRPK